MVARAHGDVLMAVSFGLVVCMRAPTSHGCTHGCLQAVTDGGALFISGDAAARLQLRNLEVAENRALEGSGGFMYLDHFQGRAQLDLNDVTLASNYARKGGSRGCAWGFLGRVLPMSCAWHGTR